MSHTSPTYEYSCPECGGDIPDYCWNQHPYCCISCGFVWSAEHEDEIYLKASAESLLKAKKAAGIESTFKECYAEVKQEFEEEQQIIGLAEVIYQQKIADGGDPKWNDCLNQSRELFDLTMSTYREES